MKALAWKSSFLHQEKETFPPDKRLTWHGSTVGNATLQRKLYQGVLAWLRALEISSDSSAPTQRPLNGITCNSAYWLI